jgi:hypothetical protein
MQLDNFAAVYCYHGVNHPELVKLIVGFWADKIAVEIVRQHQISP